MTRAQRMQSLQTQERLVAIDEVVTHGPVSPEELSALADCLAAESTAVQRRAAHAFATLGARGEPVRTVLLASLQSDVPRRRWGAAYALSLEDVPPPEAVPVLLESLGNDDSDVRWAAATIVARAREQRNTVEQLCALLAAGNPAQRKMAAYCLRDMDTRGPAIEHALFAALDDVDTGVRMAAMSALARLSANRAAVAQRLTERLRDDVDFGVRRAAAAMLGMLREPSETVLGALRAATTSADTSLQRAAQRSLRLLAGVPPPRSTRERSE